MINIAIVGGGPGGMMASWYLKKKLGDLGKTTIFEASDRLGGKIVSRRFESAPALYEAGVAEIYGYSSLGHDPLRELIESLGLQTVPMDSEAVMLDSRIIHGVEGMRERYGRKTADAIVKFRKTCASKMSPAAYYEGVGKLDNEHEWAWENAEDILNEEVDDPVARKFFRVMARSDIASESHITNGLNALKNYLMDVDGYIDVYSIQNGNEQLVEGLKAGLEAEIRLNHRVLRVGRAASGKYELDVLNGVRSERHDFDLVLICLPHNWLTTVEWTNEPLRQAMSKHIAHFDRPAHYLRVAALFDRPFWEGKVEGSWFMSEAFGGCCVYIEGSRHDVGRHGVLNWLIAGSDALAYVNLDDEALIDVALKTLPAEFGDARPHLVEAKIHRWISSVNAIPGGLPVRDVITNHVPEPKGHPGVVLVGDYLFDSTLNGLLDSADMATDRVVSEIMKLRYATGEAQRAAASAPVNPVTVPAPSHKIDRTYFDRYRGIGPYAETWRRFSDPDYIIDMIRMVWGVKGKFKLLVTGSASGELVGALRERGIDAWGIENNRYIHGKTPDALEKFNLLGSVTELPFKDESFDFIYDTALAYVSPRYIGRAVAELHRVAKRGVYFGTITSDLTSERLDQYDLLRGVKKLATWWEWSEIFHELDFELSLEDESLIEALWARTEQAHAHLGGWYEDAESLRYCFYTRLEAE